jgi:hypothetical protein
VTYDVLNLTGAPPGFYFATNVVKVPDPTPPTTTTTSKGPWGKSLPSSITTPTTSVPTATPTLSTKPPKKIVGPTIPSSSNGSSELKNRQTREDFEAICNKVDTYDFRRSEGFGGSLQVTTPLKWDGEGIVLYLRVKQRYHDKLIPGKGLYYFVGTMDVNWGKAGFRISAHTHNLAAIKKSKTYGVLHIEN